MISTILVTGVAGFVGAKTAEFLLNTGHAVVGIDNLNTYYDPRLKQHRLVPLLERDGFQFQPLDIEDGQALDALMATSKVDAVIHLAARAGVRNSIENPLLYLATNTGGTLHLLEAMKRCQVKKLVLSSTSSLYAGHTPPFKESNPVDHPLSPYAATKRAAEVLCATYHSLYQIDTSIVRYFTVYGPAGRPDMAIFRFIKWIDEGKPITLFGDGHQSRDFTYIDDIARGTIAALKPVGYEILNLGGGATPWSLLQIIQVLEELLHRKAIMDWQPAHQADLLETRADVSKAEKLLDWRPTVDLPTGLARSVEWYRQNQEWVRHISV